MVLGLGFLGSQGGEVGLHEQWPKTSMKILKLQGDYVPGSSPFRSDGSHGRQAVSLDRMSCGQKRLKGKLVSNLRQPRDLLNRLSNSPNKRYNLLFFKGDDEV